MKSAFVGLNCGCVEVSHSNVATQRLVPLNVNEEIKNGTFQLPKVEDIDFSSFKGSSDDAVAHFFFDSFICDILKRRFELIWTDIHPSDCVVGVCNSIMKPSHFFRDVTHMVNLTFRVATVGKSYQFSS